MRGSLANRLERNNQKAIIILVPVLMIAVAIAIYSISQPSITPNQTNDNTAQIETSYDYKAMVIPNILYPNGGTVEAGDTIFKKITNEIPVHIKSTITPSLQVSASGTYDILLSIQAGDLWERTFPLQQKQEFKLTGTELSIIDHTYKIELEKIHAFITQVEDETGIRSDQYTIAVVPTIQGMILYDGIETTIHAQDKLAFQYSDEEIKLASEKVFTSNIPFTTAQTMENTFKLFGITLPLSSVRLISTLLSVLLLLAVIFFSKNWSTNRELSAASQVERINKKYRSRIIPVSQKINITQKSIFTLDSFTSIIKIADEKELPIFFNKDHQDMSAVYFIVDGDYLYSYETSKIDFVPDSKKGAESENVYAKG
ncbi:MAG: DUF5305 domain-containing protein [Bacillus sp. (in: Bacteria)]|nr:DUF5305 domain-containing protein [Bacillus sp. (in: firmicutes)]